jgi:PAS domain S-box-containing protein
MKINPRRAVPLYHKLLLENKIMLLITVLLLLLGAGLLTAQYWVARDVVGRLADDLPSLLPADAPLSDGVRRPGESLPATVEQLALRMVWMVGGLMVVPVALVLLAAKLAVRRTVKPLKELTRVADEISTGNLDPRLDFGVRVNCWEIRNCQHTDCRAYLNIFEQCWYIDGTPCEGYEPRFPQKLERCRTCEVYQAHRGDEIVQLADAFKHMTSVLKRSRQDQEKAADLQRRLIRNSFDAVVATDANDIITIFNRVAEETLGISRDQVIGIRDWRDFFRDGLEKSMDRPLTHERFRRVRGFRQLASQVRREDGKLVDVILSGISLFEGGIHVGKVFFFQDVREVKQLREDLIRSERLAATGQAAAGISHSIRNILDGFMGGAYIFKAGRRTGDALKMDQGWEMIERNMAIISNLVKDLLNFSKERAPRIEAHDPAALITETLDVLGNCGRPDVVIRLEVEEPAGPVFLDQHAFQQCLANIVRNAVEAIPEGHEGLVTVHYHADGDKAVFAIRDNGVGMSGEIIEKVKSGLFSTKGSKGTGLGLLVIQKIINEHKGSLEIESQEGEGTVFRAVIPAAVARTA